VSSEKSSWPGVSRRLTTRPSCSNCITELVTEMPRSCSTAIQSEAACRPVFRARTSPGEVDRPALEEEPLGERGLPGVGWEMIPKVRRRAVMGFGIVTVFVTGVLGLTLRGLFEEFFASPMLIAGSLTITGVLLWWTDILPARKVGLKDIGLGIAVIIGVAQGLALMPGLSRSGTTIAFALFAGMKRRWAAEYSFFVAIPTILAASAVEMLSVIRKGGLETLDVSAYVVGFIVAAIVGIGALIIVLKLLYAARFRFFSFYVWFLAGVVLWASWQGHL
jgi:undecaprenyl pyrophosphate phosphatase UppP